MHPSPSGLSRRRLLSSAALSGSGLPSWMPRLAFRSEASGPSRDVLVCLFQRGGMDGLSAVVPYEESRYFELRPQIAFRAPKAGDASAIIPLDAQFGLAPAQHALAHIVLERQRAHAEHLHVALDTAADLRRHLDRRRLGRVRAPGRTRLTLAVDARARRCRWGRRGGNALDLLQALGRHRQHLDALCAGPRRQHDGVVAEGLAHRHQRLARAARLEASCVHAVSGPAPRRPAATTGAASRGSAPASAHRGVWRVMQCLR